jgi:flagellar hook-length control protein FliK
MNALQKVASDQVLPRPVRPEPVSGRPGSSGAPRDAFESLLGTPADTRRAAARPERANRVSSRNDQARPADDQKASHAETRRSRNAAERDSAPYAETRRSRDAAERDSAPYAETRRSRDAAERDGAPPENNATKTAALPATRQAKDGQPADTAEPEAAATAETAEIALAPEQAVQLEFLALVETTVVVAEGDAEPAVTGETEVKTEEAKDGGDGEEAAAVVTTEIATDVPADATATATPVAVALPTATPVDSQPIPTDDAAAELASVDPQAAAPAPAPADGTEPEAPADAAPAKVAPDTTKPEAAAKTAPTEAAASQKPAAAATAAAAAATAVTEAPAPKPQAERKTADAPKAKSEQPVAKPAGLHGSAGAVPQAAERIDAGDTKTPGAPQAKSAEAAPVMHAAPAEARNESTATPTAPAPAATAPVSASPPISPLGVVAPTLLPTLSQLTALRVERPAENAVPVAGLAVEIVARANEGSKRFEIRLDPPELGRIDVRLDVDQAGKVTSRLVVDRAETLDFLRRDAHQLERALQHAGLNTEGGLEFSLRDQSFANRDQSPRDGGNRSHLVIPEDEPAAAEAARRGYGRMIGLGGGVDIRV